eukprot:TRINITY_DN35028_c0_g1_i1.p1 TRINITY_DN35028_c0_g1~~TRINITY_DN35028_c0_g1_i1.p1  ORF type:complete len:239 (+),score=68.49 TRINITY_DN35028_c0_g1_i1:39-755(+)
MAATTPPDPLPPPALRTSQEREETKLKDENEIAVLQKLPEGVRMAVISIIQTKNRELDSLKRKLAALEETIATDSSSTAAATADDEILPPTPLSGIREITYLENEIFSLRSQNFLLRKSIETEVAKRDDSEVVAGLLSTYKTQVTKAFDKIGEMQQHLVSLNQECNNLNQENTELAAMVTVKSPAVKRRAPLQSQNKNTPLPIHPLASATRSKSSSQLDTSNGHQGTGQRQRHWVFGL